MALRHRFIVVGLLIAAILLGLCLWQWFGTVKNGKAEPSQAVAEAASGDIEGVLAEASRARAGGDFGREAEILLAGLDSYPSSGELHLALAEVCLRGDRFEHGTQDWQYGLEHAMQASRLLRGEDALHAEVLVAKGFHWKEQLEEALARYRSVLEVDPDHDAAVEGIREIEAELRDREGQ